MACLAVRRRLFHRTREIQADIGSAGANWERRQRDGGLETGFMVTLQASFHGVGGDDLAALPEADAGQVADSLAAGAASSPNRGKSAARSSASAWRLTRARRCRG